MWSLEPSWMKSSNRGSPSLLRVLGSWPRVRVDVAAMGPAKGAAVLKGFTHRGTETFTGLVHESVFVFPPIARYAARMPTKWLLMSSSCTSMPTSRLGHFEANVPKTGQTPAHPQETHHGYRCSKRTPTPKQPRRPPSPGSAPRSPIPPTPSQHGKHAGRIEELPVLHVHPPAALHAQKGRG